MWPFARKRIVDDHTAAWHLENFTWLIEEFGPAAFAQTKLVLPKPGYSSHDHEPPNSPGLLLQDFGQEAL